MRGRVAGTVGVRIRFGAKRKNLMNAVIVLLALSAVAGFALRSLSWLALARGAFVCDTARSRV
jgi:hypothetical protein